MGNHNIIREILNSESYVSLLTFLTAGIISYFSIKPILFIAKKFQLYDIPTSRKIHNHKIPVLGGAGIFFAWLLSILIFIKYNTFSHFQFFLAGVIIVILLGLKDDISGLDPLKKFTGQFVAAFIVVVLGDYRITSFYGIFGIGQLPYLLSVLFTIFVYLIVINGFNLIDGIDGLAVSKGIIFSLFFGLWFLYIPEPNQFFLISFALLGALLPFLKVNISPAKMFMGDTGSMFLGFLAAFLATVFIEYHTSINTFLEITSNPVIAMAAIFLPIYDTTRSFFVRLVKGKSPFKPDKNHVHHLLIRLGCTHMQATGILVIYSLSVLAMSLYFAKIGTGYLITFTILMVYTIVLNYILYLFVKRKEKNA
jgi:UDP-GlcNAc:undecaprenyl-phosphate GlcNAc-1-phosphate transferase